MMGWGYGPGYMMGGWSGGYWWMGLIGMAIELIFWGGIIWLIASLFRRGIQPSSNHAHSTGDALDVLRKRYARGEIDTEEYLQRKQALER